MKKFAHISAIVIMIGVVLRFTTAIYAITCNDPSACDEATNCKKGNCVPCSKTVKYNCIIGGYPSECTCQASTTCCYNGYCTVCTTDGECYTNGCPGGGGNGNDTPTPTPADPGQIRAKTVGVNLSVTNSLTQCDAVQASMNYIAQSFGISPVKGTVVRDTSTVGGLPAAWNSVPGGNYTLKPTPLPSGYTQKIACWQDDTPQGAVGTGLAAAVKPAYTTTWTLGYSKPITLKARAKVVYDTNGDPVKNPTCDQVNASTAVGDYLSMPFSIVPKYWTGIETTTDRNYATFTSLPARYYRLVPDYLPDYVLRKSCWTNTLPAATDGTGLYTKADSGTTLTWNLAFTPPKGWVQVKGGDAYAQGRILSYIPSAANPRSFLLDGTGGYPGVVTYGTNYDFDAPGATKGEEYDRSPSS